MIGPFKVELNPAAVRALRALDKPVARRIVNALDGLKATPRPATCRALTGRPGVLRIVVAKDWRVLYEVHDDRLVVLVIALGHRSTIYDR